MRAGLFRAVFFVDRFLVAFRVADFLPDFFAGCRALFFEDFFADFLAADFFAGFRADFFFADLRAPDFFADLRAPDFFADLRAADFFADLRAADFVADLRAGLFLVDFLADLFAGLLRVDFFDFLRAGFLLELPSPVTLSFTVRAVLSTVSYADFAPEAAMCPALSRASTTLSPASFALSINPLSF
ncbi:MAG: hypothetical protein KY459_05080 [Acidobacteria bacterium]|nr:hypothetical protein [Acidobacteriota bacterium]